MNWEVFTELSTVQVQTHWLLAVIAFGVGTTILLLKKGTNIHVFLGRTWVITMVVVSVSALFIRGFSPDEGMPLFLGFSPIHLLIPITLLLLYVGVRNARKQNIKTHSSIMVITFISSLLVAGAFTFLPGRHMHTFFFESQEEINEKIDLGYKK